MPTNKTPKTADEEVEETEKEETKVAPKEATEADLLDEGPKAAPKKKKVAPKEFDIDASDAVGAIDEGEEVTEQENIDGVPNRVTPRTIVKRIAGKDFLLPVFFTARTKAGLVAYGPNGQRVSHPVTEQKDTLALGRRIAHMNSIASRNAVAEELKAAPASR